MLDQKYFDEQAESRLTLSRINEFNQLSFHKKLTENPGFNATMKRSWAIIRFGCRSPGSWPSDECRRGVAGEVPMPALDMVRIVVLDRSLAQLQLRVVLEEWLSRISKFEITKGCKPHTIGGINKGIPDGRLLGRST